MEREVPKLDIMAKFRNDKNLKIEDFISPLKNRPNKRYVYEPNSAGGTETELMESPTYMRSGEGRLAARISENSPLISPNKCLK